MVSLNAWHAHFADEIQTFPWIGIVANDISHAGVMGTTLVAAVLKNRCQRFEIGMNVSEDCIPICAVAHDQLHGVWKETFQEILDEMNQIPANFLRKFETGGAPLRVIN